MYKEVKDSKKNWTDAQKLAIGLSGGSILVTASAGSGKTAVLTERIISRLTDSEDPADLRDFVVVTFTKAAAVQMKARLGKRLNDYVREHPEDNHVKCQLMYLPEANISTIHSFCLSLLEKYQSSPRSDYYPGVKISSDGEAKLLFKKAVRKAVEDGFDNPTEEFYILADAMSDGGGGTGGLNDAVKALHFQMNTIPDRDVFVKRTLACFEPDYWSAATNSLMKNLFDNLIRAASYYLKLLGGLIAEVPDPNNQKLAAQIDYLNGISDVLKDIVKAAGERDLGRCSELLNTGFGKMPTKPAGYDEWCDRRTALVGSSGAVTGFMKKAAGEFAFTEAGLRDDAETLGVIVRELFKLTNAAEKEYAALKKDRGIWDYSDLETKACALLWEPDENGSLRRTDVSLEEGKKHKEILIDEYQDVNSIQEKIFLGICSEDDDNIFMVGDVKQSIYGFRGAEPGLFLKHRDEYRPATLEDTDFPAKVGLNANFRSRKSVTDAVNAVFNAIMTKETSGVDYTEDELVPYTPERDEPLSGSYFTVVRGGRSEEGKYVASKIKELVDGGMTVSGGDDKEPRGVRYGDITILLRSKKQSHIKPYADALSAAGIPYSAPDSAGCFDVPSVRRMISVLRAIDNPMKDIDLAAAMISGAFGFSESDLMRIRNGRHGVFYYAVKEAADAGDVACGNFIKELDRLRCKASVLTVDKLIWYIYKSTGYLSFASALCDGRRERNALMRFYENAVAYGYSGRQDLSGYVSYIDRLLDEEAAPQEGATAGSGNEVRIMTIHQAKGLEFPVCFLCDVGSEFNEDDVRKPFIIDGGSFEKNEASDEPIIAVKIVNHAEHKKRDTAARKLAAARVRDKMRREEMRVLYVALTRASERLEIVASAKDPAEFREANMHNLGADGRMDTYCVTSANSALKWLAPVAFGTSAFTVEVDPNYAAPEVSAAEAPAPDEELAGRIFERISGKYGYSASASVPTKLTVSDIVAMKAGKSESDRICERKPACLEREKRGGAEAGTATHAFLQFADFSKLGDIDGELKRLVDMRFITENQARLVDRRKLENFISSEIFKRICASESVTREFKFTFETDASDYIEAAPGEKILVQGAIDCCFIEDGKCVIVDYKTDRITDNIDEKVKHYRPQLEIYARGLKDMTGAQVSEAVLYFLDADKEERVI